MTRRTENKYKGRSQSSEYAKDGKGFGGGLHQKKRDYPSSESQGAGAGKYGPRQTAGRDSQPKPRTYTGDKYASSPPSTRSEQHGPPHWERSRPDRHGIPAHGPTMEDVPRKESFVPHQGMPPISRADFPRPVEASALIKGLQAGRDEITEMLQAFVNMATASFTIKEIELSLSFNTSGKFLGIGVGGATSIKIKIAPTSKG